MSSLAKLSLATLLALALPAGASHAQNESPPAKKSTSGDAGKDFSEAGKRLGEGAEKVGEGFKNGAIQAWEAVKAGAQAVGNKLNGQSSSAPRKSASPNEPSH